MTEAPTVRHKRAVADGMESAALADSSFYGTFDQGGNLWERNDAVIGSSRGLRGGSWLHGDSTLLSSFSGSNDPSAESFTYGFRVASVPEPASIVLTMLAGCSLAFRRKR